MSLAKVTLNDIGTLANNASARQALNDNFQKIEDEFKKVVYRDGSTPNSMEADIDLNSHRVLNVADAVHDKDAVNKGQVSDIAYEAAEVVWQPRYDALVNEVEDELSRTLKLPSGYTNLYLPLPDPSKFLGWNTDGSGLRNIDPTGPADLTLRTDLAEATGAEIIGADIQAPNADPADETVLDHLKRLLSGVVSRVLSAVSPTPIVESAYSVDLGGDYTNSAGRKAVTITGAATAGQPATGYVNAVDLTPDYIFLKNESGHNEATDTNDGRTGVFAHRVRLLQAGQGDAVAYNASVRITSPPIENATHWLANAAGVIINGTVIGEADGCYLNPFEFHLTDKPGSTAYNTSCVGIVLNMNRNHPNTPKVDGGVGQVWAGIRAQSTGPNSVDAILSGTGKYFSGIDLSMPNLDFGTNKCAIALKAGDRMYFNAKAVEQDDSFAFIRANWRATQSFADYCYYDASTLRWKVVVGGTETLQVSTNQVTVKRLACNEDVTIDAAHGLYLGGSKIIGGRVTGWTRMTGTANKTTAFDTATVTLEQLAQRVKALEDALHLSGGPNGILGS